MHHYSNAAVIQKAKYFDTATNYAKTKLFEAETLVQWSNTAINLHYWLKLVA